MPYFPEAEPLPPIRPAADFDAYMRGYRASLPVLARHIYLNHASVGPLSDWVVEAVNGYLRLQQFGESTSVDPLFDGWRWSRQRMGELIGASRQAICLQPSINAACLRVFAALPLGPGDEAICTADDFPSMYHALNALAVKGAKIVHAQSGRGDGIVRLDDVLNTITPATKLVAVSWVGFIHGYCFDLAALGAACRERGIWLLVDSIQGLGALSLNVKDAGVHFLAAHGAKFLLSPLASGFLYVDESVPPEITPLDGWLGYELNHDSYADRAVRPKANANRFSAGTWDLAVNFGLQRACEMLMAGGLERVQQRCLALTDRLDDAATAAGLSVYSDRRLPDGSFGPQRSAIVTLRLPEGSAVPDRLRAAGVAFSVREGMLRLSPHWYISDAEIDRVCALLAG